MPLEEADEFVGFTSDPSVVLDGVMHDLAEVRRRSTPLAEGALAGAAIAMALEVENPFNSATSKSMCANALRDAMAQIRDLMPPEQETNEFAALRARRTERLAGQSSPANPVGT